MSSQTGGCCGVNKSGTNKQDPGRKVLPLESPLRLIGGE